MKLTHIWYEGRGRPDYYVHLKPTLSELKSLPVGYLRSKGKKIPVYERKRENAWHLIANNKTIGQEGDTS